MTFQLPPIVKLAERILLDIEQAVRRFPRYHRYSVGADLRSQAMEVARLGHRAWRAQQERPAVLERLAEAVDDLKLTLQLASQLKAFGSFAQFEAISRQAFDLGRQVGGWRKQQHPKGQNAGADARPQRAQTLSSRAACKQATT